MTDLPTSKDVVQPKDRFRRVDSASQFRLLPCRLCGSPAELWQRWRRDDVWDSFACCTNLEDVDGEACLFHLPDDPHFYCDRKKDAACHWNLIMGPRSAHETSGKHAALAREISERHTRVNNLLWGPGAAPGTMLGPMDADAAHADRGRLLSLLTPEQRGAVEPEARTGAICPDGLGECDRGCNAICARALERDAVKAKERRPHKELRVAGCGCDGCLAI